jgi:hypothetical protein
MAVIGKAGRVLAAAAAFLPFASCSANDAKNSFPSGGSSAQGGSGNAGGTAGNIDPGTGGTGNIGTTGGASGTGGNGTGGTGPVIPVIDNCPGSIDGATATALRNGGPVDGQMKWLYPYDKTVFPRGLLAPVLQWAPAGGQPPQAVYIHIKSNGFEYHGCFGPTDPVRIQLPDDVWNSATALAQGQADPLNVELTTSVGGTVSGPIKQIWAIAPASLKGEVYYNTYSSPQVQNNGAVMRIAPGQRDPQAFLFVNGLAPLGPCVSCHSLSANGQRMVAANHSYPAGPYVSNSYAITPNSTPNPAALPANLADAEAGFGALTPDGSKLLTTGSPGTTTSFPLALFPNGPGNVVGMVGPKPSRLYDTNTGQVLTSNGLVEQAKMPMFSPDGRKVVFNDHAASNGHSLAVMDFDPATNTFSNKVEIFRQDQLFAGWPFFTPDSKGVIFVLGDAPDYVSSHPARIPVARSELFYVDVASRRSVRLSRAGGFEGNQSYVPYPGRDERYEFFPTVSPVAAGGYYWVFFTSRRNYGNTIVGAVDLAPSKKIWVSAIDINPPAGVDPSHPAFYLPGQELESGNVRAFAALEPCRDNGADCSSGIDCCCGACNEQGKCDCVKDCAKLSEKCTTSADCCNKAHQCIAGYCEPIIPG